VSPHARLDGIRRRGVGGGSLSFVSLLSFPFVNNLLPWYNFYLFGKAYAEGKGKLATCRHRADSGEENGQKVCRHSVVRLHASMVKKIKKKKPMDMFTVHLQRKILRNDVGEQIVYRYLATYSEWRSFRRRRGQSECGR
jgi:hypothetical protein